MEVGTYLTQVCGSMLPFLAIRKRGQYLRDFRSR